MATTNSPNSAPIVAIQSENIEEEIRKLETNAVPQEEYERMLSENTETQPQPLDKREINKLQAMFGNAKAQVAKYFLNEDGKKVTLTEKDVKKESTLLFKNCTNGYYEIGSPCTKLLIDACDGSTFVLNERIMTSTLDIYKCSKLKVNINIKLGTVQADLCKDLHVEFLNKDLITQLVWAGVHNLTVAFTQNSNLNLKTGFEEMCKLHGELRETIDQFIVRHIKEQILCERVIRLENGFPTTAREKKIYDDRQEEAIQRLAKEAGITIGRKQEKKIPPNSICPKCNSGKKYKKCCGKNG
jgi:hypothetical protein